MRDLLPVVVGVAWHEARFVRLEEDAMNSFITGIFVVAAATLALAAPAVCDPGAEVDRAAHGVANVRIAASDQPADADNTARNVRDRDSSRPTPMDQGNGEADRNITAHIRKDIVANDALSTNAHNVKIITTDGVVTLRGPVKTVQEKAAVAAAAHRAPGVKRVDNELEIERAD
jgi:hypothetical protein